MEMPFLYELRNCENRARQFRNPPTILAYSDRGCSAVSGIAPGDGVFLFARRVYVYHRPSRILFQRDILVFPNNQSSFTLHIRYH